MRIHAFMKRWPLKKAYLWERAPFFRILLLFVLGILFYYLLPYNHLNNSVLLTATVAGLAVFAVVSGSKKLISRFPTLPFAGLMVFLFGAGVTTSFHTDIRNDKSWFGNHLTAENAYQAIISGKPTDGGRSWKIPVRLVQSIADGHVAPVSGAAFIYCYKGGPPMLFRKGDTVLVPGNWEPITNAGNPFEFDYAEYCGRNNIFYRQYCGLNQVRLYAQADQTALSLPDRTHDWCMAQLDKYLTAPTARHLMEAMLLGDEVNLDEDMRQAYSQAGVFHIIAISGGHIAVLFIVVSALLFWLRGGKYQWAKFAVALPLAWFYVLMAGAPPSAIRAGIMFSLLAGARLFGKDSSPVNQLFATAFVLLCAQPQWLFSLGFQLSFMAVSSILSFYVPVCSMLAPRHRLTRWLWRSVAAGFAVEILVAPLVIYYFHTFPVLFFIANVVAYVFMGLVLTAGLAIVVFSGMPAIAGFFAAITTYLVAGFGHVVAWLQAANPISFRFLVLRDWELALVYLAIGCLAYAVARKYKPALFGSLAALCLLLLSLNRDEWQRLRQDRLVIYNVPGTTRIDRITGTTYCPLSMDTSMKGNYVPTLAHTGWAAWREDTSHKAEIMRLCHKTALTLNDDFDTAGAFHTDILILNHIPEANPITLQKIFSPSLVVIGNNYTRQQQTLLAQQFRSAGMAVHVVATDGAFVLDSGD